MSAVSILDIDQVLSRLCGVAATAGYRVEFGYNEMTDPNAAGVCVYSKRLIQLAPPLRKMPVVAQWTLIHELAHALLHDSYENDGGATGTAHEREANTVRKIVWPHVNNYPFDYEETLDLPTAEVQAVADRMLSALRKLNFNGLPPTPRTPVTAFRKPRLPRLVQAGRGSVYRGLPLLTG